MSDNENKNIKSKLKRIVAIIGLIIILGLIITMIVCAITGSPYFIVSLYALIIASVLIYVFIWLAGVIEKSDKDTAE